MGGSKRSRIGKGKEKAGTSQPDRAPPIPLVSSRLPTNIHPNLRFTFQMCPEYNAWNAILLKIIDKDIVYPRQIDWRPLEEAGLAARLRVTLTQTVRSSSDGYTYIVDDWERFFDIKEPIYRELCLEFFSTVTMFKIKRIEDKLFEFRLGGEARIMSLLDIALSLGIYTEEEQESVYFHQFIYEGAWLDEDELDMDTVWGTLSDVPYSSGNNYASSLSRVEHRLIQKFIAHSIACRGKNAEKVNAQDMWYLHHFMRRRRMSIPYCVAESLNFHGDGRRQPSKISGGALYYIVREIFRGDFETPKSPIYFSARSLDTTFLRDV